MNSQTRYISARFADRSQAALAAGLAEHARISVNGGELTCLELVSLEESISVD